MLKNTNKLLVGLCALTTLSQVSLPAVAEIANVQEGTQVITQDGSGHNSFQRGRQEIRHQSRGQVTPEGNVQGIYQDTMQIGENGYSDQQMEQRIEVQRGRRGKPGKVTVEQ